MGQKVVEKLNRIFYKLQSNLALSKLQDQGRAITVYRHTKIYMSADRKEKVEQASEQLCLLSHKVIKVVTHILKYDAEKLESFFICLQQYDQFKLNQGHCQSKKAADCLIEILAYETASQFLQKLHMLYPNELIEHLIQIPDER